jgi:hypothetical protein
MTTKQEISQNIKPQSLICNDCEYVSPVAFVTNRNVVAPVSNIHIIIFMIFFLVIALFIYCFIYSRKNVIEEPEKEEEIEEEIEDEEEEIEDEEEEIEDEEEEFPEIVYPLKNGPTCVTFYDAIDRLHTCPTNLEYDNFSQSCIPITETGCVGTQSPFVGDDFEFDCSQGQWHRRSFHNSCQLVVNCFTNQVNRIFDENICFLYRDNLFIQTPCSNVPGCRHLSTHFADLQSEISLPPIDDTCNEYSAFRWGRNPCKSVTICNQQHTIHVANMRQCLTGIPPVLVNCSEIPRCAYFAGDIPMQTFADTLQSAKAIENNIQTTH